jgi:pseudouridine synthase
MPSGSARCSRRPVWPAARQTPSWRPGVTVDVGRRSRREGRPGAAGRGRGRAPDRGPPGAGPRGVPPAGVTSPAADRHAARTVLDLVPAGLVPRGTRLYPVGRLDLDSEGLLVLTNDGAWTERVLHPRHGVEREYAVAVALPLDNEQRAALAAGIRLEEGLARLVSLRPGTRTETAPRCPGGARAGAGLAFLVLAWRHAGCRGGRRAGGPPRARPRRHAAPRSPGRVARRLTRPRCGLAAHARTLPRRDAWGGRTTERGHDDGRPTGWGGEGAG